MLSTQLNAEQLQQVLEKMRLNVYSGIEPALVVETISE
jgi:uridylate kinase